MTGGTGTQAKPQDNKAWAESDGTGDRNAVFFLTGTAGKIASMLGTAFLMIVCPAVAIYMAVIFIDFKGDLAQFLKFSQEVGFTGVRQLWPHPSKDAWLIFGTFGAFEAFLQLALPGKIVNGPVSPKGNVPVYKANGVQAFVVTLVAFFVGWKLNWFDPGFVYDKFVEVLAAANIFALLLCAFISIKGLYLPSSSDSGTTGFWLYDYFWGTELYPRIGRHFDIKTWTNCRMGMMSWSVLILCYAVKQYQLEGAVADSMLVSVVLMNVYVFKFFLWEAGYWNTMDIAHDRAGYYLCWGCLNWVPSIYTSPALYLVKHPLVLGNLVAGTILFLGLLSIWINYDCDRQRQEFRRANGRIKIWGRDPKIVYAKYKTGKGEEKSSILLASGWWGISRHFHYLPELLASFFWTVPGLFHHILPYFYVVYLTILLYDRAFRDDTRCRSKYNKYWDEYCQYVPYKMVPFIF